MNSLQYTNNREDRWDENSQPDEARSTASDVALDARSPMRRFWRYLVDRPLV
jgi:hypothetical protein